MYPVFNIYQSILSGSGQPGLPPNREPERFERLLSAVRSSGGCACSSFFLRLVALADAYHGVHIREFRREALQLADSCGCGSSNVFLSIPAHDFRENFYNQLTGYSLQNYEASITHLLRNHRKGITGKWYHYRLVDKLHFLLHLHLPANGLPVRTLLISCRVKAATAILMHRLMTDMPVRENGFHTRRWPREELQSQLAACNLEPPHRSEVIELFDKATASAGSPAPQSDPIRMNPADEQLLNSNLSELAKETQSVHKSLQKILEKFSTNPHRRVSSDEACSILGISRKSLKRLRDSGKLKFYNNGGKYTYLVSDLNNLARERTNVKKQGNRIARNSDS